MSNSKKVPVCHGLSFRSLTGFVIPMVGTQPARATSALAGADVANHPKNGGVNSTNKMQDTRRHA